MCMFNIRNDLSNKVELSQKWLAGSLLVGVSFLIFGYLEIFEIWGTFHQLFEFVSGHQCLFFCLAQDHPQQFYGDVVEF